MEWGVFFSLRFSHVNHQGTFLGTAGHVSMIPQGLNRKKTHGPSMFGSFYRTWAAPSSCSVLMAVVAAAQLLEPVPQLRGPSGRLGTTVQCAIKRHNTVTMTKFLGHCPDFILHSFQVLKLMLFHTRFLTDHSLMSYLVGNHV